MSEAKKLKEEYDKAVIELQNRCKHETTKWMWNEWAPGHICGKVKVCLNCWKQLLEESDLENVSVQVITNKGESKW